MQKLEKTNIVFEVLTHVTRELYLFDSELNMKESLFNKRRFLEDYDDLSSFCDTFSITCRDVYNECVSICNSIDDMPKVACFLKNRLDCAVNEAMCDIDVFDYLLDEDHLNNVFRLLDKNLKEGYLSESEYHQVSNDFFIISLFLDKWICNINNIIERFSLKSESEHNADTTIEKLNQTFPKELDTEEAKKWLNMAVEGGLLDADYQPTEKTKTKALQALLAEILKDLIGLENYKPFELLWSVKGIAKQRYNTRNQVGKVKGQEEIYKVFK